MFARFPLFPFTPLLILDKKKIFVCHTGAASRHSLEITASWKRPIAGSPPTGIRPSTNDALVSLYGQKISVMYVEWFQKVSVCVRECELKFVM